MSDISRKFIAHTSTDDVATAAGDRSVGIVPSDNAEAAFLD